MVHHIMVLCAILDPVGHSNCLGFVDNVPSDIDRSCIG